MLKKILFALLLPCSWTYIIAQNPLSQKNNTELPNDYKKFEYIKNTQTINHNNNVTLEISRIIPKNLNSLLAISIIQSVEENIVLDVCLHAERNSCMDLFIAYKALVELYKGLQKEYADLGLWKGTFDYNVLYDSPVILCISETVVYETDGHSDMQSLSYLLFDTKTGNILLEEDLFKDINLAAQTAEKAFKNYWLQEHELSITDYNTAGFSFPDNQFVLPIAIGIDEENILLSFDKGEYIHDVYGAITIKVPKADFADNLLYQ